MFVQLIPLNVFFRLQIPHKSLLALGRFLLLLVRQGGVANTSLDLHLIALPRSFSPFISLPNKHSTVECAQAEIETLFLFRSSVLHIMCIQKTWIHAGITFAIQDCSVLRHDWPAGFREGD